MQVSMWTLQTHAMVFDHGPDELVPDDSQRNQACHHLSMRDGIWLTDRRVVRGIEKSVTKVWGVKRQNQQPLVYSSSTCQWSVSGPS